MLRKYASTLKPETTTMIAGGLSGLAIVSQNPERRSLFLFALDLEILAKAFVSKAHACAVRFYSPAPMPIQRVQAAKTLFPASFRSLPHSPSFTRPSFLFSIVKYCSRRFPFVYTFFCSSNVRVRYETFDPAGKNLANFAYCEFHPCKPRIFTYFSRSRIFSSLLKLGQSTSECCEL